MSSVRMLGHVIAIEQNSAKEKLARIEIPALLYTGNTLFYAPLVGFTLGETVVVTVESEPKEEK